MGEGSLYPAGLIIECIFCLQVDGAITWGACKWERGLISSGAYNRMYFLFTGRWAYNWGFISGGMGLKAAVCGMVTER